MGARYLLSFHAGFGTQIDILYFTTNPNVFIERKGKNKDQTESHENYISGKNFRINHGIGSSEIILAR